MLNKLFDITCVYQVGVEVQPSEFDVSIAGQTLLVQFNLEGDSELLKGENL